MTIVKCKTSWLNINDLGPTGYQKASATCNTGKYENVWQINAGDQCLYILKVLFNSLPHKKLLKGKKWDKISFFPKRP